jgi:TonB family protein
MPMEVAMTGRLVRVVAAFSLLWMVSPSPARAQSPRSETDLLAAASQDPQQIGNYLDLARLYFDQGRLEEAQQMINRATAIIRQRQAERQTVVNDTMAAVRVGGDIREPRKIKDVKPVYPAEAQAAGVQGVVIMEVTISPQGDVASARILRSIPMLDQAAANAVAQWKFEPTLLNGAAVPVLMTVTVNFTKQ